MSWGKFTEASAKKEEIKEHLKEEKPSWAAAVKPVEEVKEEPVKANERPATANKKAADKKKPTAVQEEAPKKVQETPKPNPPAQEKKSVKFDNPVVTK